MQTSLTGRLCRRSSRAKGLTLASTEASSFPHALPSGEVAIAGEAQPGSRYGTRNASMFAPAAQMALPLLA